MVLGIWILVLMKNNPLLSKKCVPCEGGVDPLKGEELKSYESYINSEWKMEGLIDKEKPSFAEASDGKGKKLSRKFKFKDFKEAMGFVNKVADIAESEGHHPDIYIYYNKVNLELTTHAIDGISPNDFIVAAKIDAISE